MRLEIDRWGPIQNFLDVTITVKCQMANSSFCQQKSLGKSLVSAYNHAVESVMLIDDY